MWRVNRETRWEEKKIVCSRSFFLEIVELWFRSSVLTVVMMRWIRWNWNFFHLYLRGTSRGFIREAHLPFSLKLKMRFLRTLYSCHDLIARCIAKFQEKTSEGSEDILWAAKAYFWSEIVNCWNWIMWETFRVPGFIINRGKKTV